MFQYLLKTLDKLACRWLLYRKVDFIKIQHAHFLEKFDQELHRPIVVPEKAKSLDYLESEEMQKDLILKEVEARKYFQIHQTKNESFDQAWARMEEEKKRFAWAQS
jgi:hypothetical protein